MATRYKLYLCDITGEHKSIAVFESESPFISVNIGDRYDDHGWDRLDGVGIIASEDSPKRYTVHSIKHTLLKKDRDLVNEYWLNLEPHSGARSPVWQED